VLILLPEIALTQAFLDRFHDRFGAKPAEWHSDLPPRMRERSGGRWRKGTVRSSPARARRCSCRSTISASSSSTRSTTPAYKQEDRVFYNARDMAVVRGAYRRLSGRARLGDAVGREPGQCRPQGRYRRVHLPAASPRRRCRRSRAIDMRRGPPARGGFLSPPADRAVRQDGGAGEQSLLFLNRRGYAPLTLCRVCGHRFQCPHCSSWLVEHRFRGQLVCHHCGHSTRSGRMPARMRHARPSRRLRPRRRAHRRGGRRPFPGCAHHRALLRHDRRREALRLELEAIAKGEADIVIGTQLVAKGHNFPNMTLVGVVDADLGLANGDPRAAERTFQLLSQVTGRAGRTGKKSRGLLQTYQPDHPVMQAIVSGDSPKPSTNARSPSASARCCRPSAGSPGSSSAPTAAPTPKAMRAACAGRAAGAPTSPCSGRPRRRWRWSRPAPLPAARPRRAPRRHAGLRPRRCWPAGRRPRGSVRVQVDIDPQSFLLMFAPRIAFRMLRLTTAEAHPNAIAQARATMSGFYLGLGLCCILFAQPMLYIALGVSWAFTVFGRIISMMSDQGNTPYNWVALVLECVLAALPLAYGLGFVP
jgi:primosomal protein N' (replication factor Y)